MADNILNAMRGLTEYLMTENQRLDQERKEQKINLVSERIAEAYQRLGPNATLEEIQNLQYQAMEDAAAVGTIQQMLPLIQSMTQSSLSMYQVRKGEQTSNAVRRQIEQWTGQKIDPNISGEAAVNLTQLAKTLNPDQQVTTAEGMTMLRRFNPDGSLKSEQVINAFGAEQQLDLFKKQEDIRLANSLKEIDRRGMWEVKARGVSNGTGVSGNVLDPQGAKLMKGYMGQDGEVLYTDAKGMGVYALQPDGRLMFYNKLPKKVNEQDLKDRLNTVKAAQDVTEGARIEAYNTVYTVLGEEAIKELTKQLDIPKGQDLSTPTKVNVDALYKALDSANWQKDVNAVINNLPDLDRPQFPGLAGNNKTMKDKYWDVIKDFKRTMYNAKQLEKQAFGINQSNTSDIENIPGGLSLEQWNQGNQKIQKYLSGTGNIRNAIQQWISQINKIPADSITFNDFGNLPKDKQAALIKIIDTYVLNNSIKK